MNHHIVTDTTPIDEHRIRKVSMGDRTMLSREREAYNQATVDVEGAGQPLRYYMKLGEAIKLGCNTDALDREQLEYAG